MIRRLLKSVLRWLVREAEPPETPDQLIERLRARGVRIGGGCEIYTEAFSTEPYLVTIGNRVAISGGTKFITHDGAAWLLRPQNPNLQFLGEIEIVRGRIPENSLVVGNPGRVIDRASLLLAILARRRGAIDSFNLREPERARVILERFRREAAAKDRITPETDGP